MPDEPNLQVRPKDHDSSLALSRTRTEIVARGRRDAAALPIRPVDDILALLRKSLAESGQKSEEQNETELREDRRLALQGDLNAQRTVGSHHYRSNDYIEAARWFRMAAEQGDPLSQYEIGEMSRRGMGVAQDHAAARDWLRRSAEQGFEEAKWSLIDIYYFGPGVPQNYAETVKWLTKAPGYGESFISCYFLGLINAEGDGGVPQDDVEAYKWFSLAASNAARESHDLWVTITRDYPKMITKALETLTAKLTPEQIADAQGLARDWKPTGGTHE